jgi:formamidopyrimidine-DNA glycosylase
MPELPEVETIARGVNERLRGDRIAEVWFSGRREPFKTPPARQAKGLEGRAILAVHRAGKHIVCDLGLCAPQPGERLPSRPAADVPSAQWIVHLGMTGRLLVTTPDAPLALHTHARLSLVSGFRAPGADPLTVTAGEFVQLFHGRRLAIKAALLNQKLLAGVGNIYADESLFRARIRPRRASERLTRCELERLRLALCEVLDHAIRLGGSSVSDYVDADGVRGFFQLEHCVYLRTGLPCRQCQTPIRRIVLAGRGTHYCPKCQK